MQRNYARRKVLARRRLAGTPDPFPGSPRERGVHVLDIDARGEGTGPRHSGGRVRMATVGTYSDGNHPTDPTFAIGKAITAALDPRTAPGPVRTLAQMTPDEIAALEKQYGAKVKR